jgi:hypothetical protein
MHVVVSTIYSDHAQKALAADSPVGGFFGKWRAAEAQRSTNQHQISLTRNAKPFFHCFDRRTPPSGLVFASPYPSLDHSAKSYKQT